MASIGQYKGVDISGGSQADIQAQMALIDGQQAKPVTPITPGSLENTKPISVPAEPVSTGLSGFQGYLETQSTGLQAKADKAENAKNNSGKMLADALFGAQGQTEITDSLYSQDGGVDETQRELDDINQQILQEQEALRRELETIEDNVDGRYGVTKGAVQARMDEARRKSLRTQADLSVVQMAKQGRYDSAKQIADRAVSAILEKQKMNIDTLRFMYEDLKEDWSKADQRAFEVAQKERERKYEAEEYRLRAEFDQKIKQSDPMYQLQLKNLRLENQKLQASFGTNYNMEISQEEFNKLPSMDKNNMTLLQIMSNPKILAGNRTVIGAGLSLARAAQDLAGANPDAEFAGLYPFRGVVDFFTPEAFKREKTVSNEAAINALNLQTQFWASGAALTEMQTEYVLGLIPTKNDTDKAAKTKLNTLVNYMMTQTSAKLMTDGVNFKPEPINLFETKDLLNQASEEQLAELRELKVI